MYNATNWQKEHDSKVMYTEEEMRMNLIYCVAELTSHSKSNSETMKSWNDRTNEWFNKNKK